MTFTSLLVKIEVHGNIRSNPQRASIILENTTGEFPDREMKYSNVQACAEVLGEPSRDLSTRSQDTISRPEGFREVAQVISFHTMLET